MSVPYSYSSMTVELPSLDVEETDLSPESELTESSIGVVTSSSMSSGDAPEYCAITISMGESISGESSRVIPVTELMPNTIRQTTASMVVTGLLRTNLVIPIIYSPPLLCILCLCTALKPYLYSLIKL